ncbi:uncharacterized protein LOC117819261 [Notolabrus celidotus]|uniref:uncharacterized protein LOC117819261 n=1 Tax=Notolabrus celidotus TaxID=1203425 RepID=UPI001490047A|nr:uncharacterized protein LOC117819261 [Notolabrus celidotus]
MFATHWTPSPSVTEVSVSIDPKPSDPPRPVSTPTVTEISDHPTPSDPPRTSPPPTGETAVPDTCATLQLSSGTNIVCTLVAVIAVLASLLFVVCFLVVHRRNRSNKTVTPGKEGRDEAGETSSRSSQSLDQTEKTRHNENDHSDTEAGWRRAFNGVRAKSANAILSTLPFCAPVKDQVTFQSETKAPKPGDETELDEETGTGNPTKKTEGNAEKDVDENPLCSSPHADTVPYLSIGANQNETSPGDSDKQSKDSQNERSVMDKVMSRISTWPLTAMQWQTRCKMTEEEEEKVTEVFTVLTPELQGDLKKDFHKVKHPLDSGEAKTEEGSGKNPQDECLTMNPAHMNLCSPQSSKPKVNATFQRPKKEDKIQDQHTNPGLYKDKAGRSKDLKPAERSTKKSSRGSNKAEQRNESKRAETSGQREANRSSQAPSGGASPDDETLLSGNEYAFMDLLHEVVQNNGRWTRDRWRQTHGNKQRR